MKKGGGILAGEAAKSVRAVRSRAAKNGAVVNWGNRAGEGHLKPRSFSELELEELGGDFYHDFIDT